MLVLRNCGKSFPIVSLQDRTIQDETQLANYVKKKGLIRVVQNNVIKYFKKNDREICEL